MKQCKVAIANYVLNHIIGSNNLCYTWAYEHLIHLDSSAYYYVLYLVFIKTIVRTNYVGKYPPGLPPGTPPCMCAKTLKISRSFVETWLNWTSQHHPSSKIILPGPRTGGCEPTSNDLGYPTVNVSAKTILSYLVTCMCIVFNSYQPLVEAF